MVKNRSCITKLMLVLLIGSSVSSQAFFLTDVYNSAVRTVKQGISLAFVGTCLFSVAYVCYKILLSNKKAALLKTFSGKILSKKRRKTPAARARKPRARKKPTAIPKKKKIIMQSCESCLDDKNETDFDQLHCGHKPYCKGCLNYMIDIAMRDKSTAGLRCPNCSQKFSEQDIRNITDNNRDKLTDISDIEAQEWLAKQPGAKHCPTPDCDFYFINDTNRQEQIHCPQCEQRYCSKCLSNHSMQITCEQAKQRKTGKKISSSEANKLSEQWEKNYTKPCPQCGAPIEKDGGCNHMTCRKCRYKFCYNCMKKWDPSGRDPNSCGSVGFYACGRHDHSRDYGCGGYRHHGDDVYDYGGY